MISSYTALSESNALKYKNTTSVITSGKKIDIAEKIDHKINGVNEVSNFDGLFKSFKIENKNLHPDLKEKLESMWKSCKTEAEKLTFIDMYALTFASSPGDEAVWGDNWKQSLKTIMTERRAMMGSVSPETRLSMLEHEKIFNKLLS